MSKKARILTVGGGSGGHILPVVATVGELLKLSNKQELEIHFWCDFKSYTMAQRLFKTSNVAVSRIISGKFRRYHHFKWWQHLYPTILGPNIFDLFKFMLGFLQSLFKLIIWRPRLVVAKGGFVCLPVGLAARVLGIKIVIHDSDVVAGLTNRFLGHFASKIATGYPAEHYAYDAARLVYTGIPIDATFRPLGSEARLALKRDLGFDSKQLILVVGGGLGSTVLNQVALKLAEQSTDYQIVLISGKANYQAVCEQLRDKRIKNLIIKDFVSDLSKYIKASDLVISRAGATTLAELSAAGALAIIVPNHRLVAGHQIANAQILAAAGAALVVNEAELFKKSRGIVSEVRSLLSKKQQDLEKQRQCIQQFAKPDAALELAQLIKQEANLQ